MLAFLKRSASCRTILVEKTDRLYRNLKDYVTLDELDLEIHFVKENVVLEDLKEDIREHGLREPITVFENRILDGTHR
jgi:ParB-like chromosome segregation protein Spo0J